VRERGGLSYFGDRVNKAEAVFGERSQRPLSWLVGSAISPGGRELNLDFNKGNTRRKPVIAAEGKQGSPTRSCTVLFAVLEPPLVLLQPVTCQQPESIHSPVGTGLS
jgi:hypothetical protein